MEGGEETGIAMEGEVRSLVPACFLVLASLAYCYALPSWTSPGKWRLLAVLPVAVLFALLPFSFSTVHLRGISAFFLCWLGTFKLLLFSLGRGPLAPLCTAGGPTRNLSLPAFIATAALPIKIRQNPLPRARGAPHPVLTVLGFAVKGLLLAFIVSLYPNRRRFHRNLVLALYSLHLYLSLDMVLGGAAAVGRWLLPEGAELEPQFAAPYLSSSLQDFWGRRWNLMVSDILRLAVYVPVRAAWGPAVGVVSAFLMSGVMHEVMFYYLTLEPPTGEVASFFVLHGVCTAAEIAAKRWCAGRGVTPLQPALAAPLTIGFVAATGWWLFFPQITRCAAEETVVAESEAVVRLLWRAVGGGR